MNLTWALRIAGAMTAFGLVFVQPTRAEACGGCFHASTDEGTSFVTDHRMVLSISKTQTVLWDQVKYTGDPSEFAWVLPVRNGTRVELARDEWISALDAATKVTVKGPDISCPGGGGGGFSGGGGGGFSGCGATTVSASAPTSFGGGLIDSGAAYDAGQGVQVVGQAVVGPYQSVIVRSDRGEAISLWLKDNGFIIPDVILPTLVAYTREGFDFLALKLRPGEGVHAMRPVRVVSPGASYALPLRMVAAGIGAKVGLNLFVITEGRVEAKNFPNATIDPASVTWDPATSRSNYRALLETALAAGNGRTWVTESAVSPREAALSPIVEATEAYRNVCRRIDTIEVPCDDPFATDAGTTDAGTTDAGTTDAGDEMTDGGSPDVGPPPPPPPPRMCRKSACEDFSDDTLSLNGLRTGDIWVTRLHAELTGENCSQADLQLQAGPQATVTSRLQTQTFSDPNFKPCGANAANGSDANDGCTCRQSAAATFSSVPWVAAFTTATLALMLRSRRRERQPFAKLAKLAGKDESPRAP